MDWTATSAAPTDPGGGYRCDVDRGARYVGVLSKSGALVTRPLLQKTRRGRGQSRHQGHAGPVQPSLGKEGAV